MTKTGPSYDSDPQPDDNSAPEMAVAELIPWDRHPLSGGPIAITLLAEDTDGGRLAAVASEPDSVFFLNVLELIGFLILHADRTLVCHDAASLHWRLRGYLVASGAKGAVDCLWQFSGDYRLGDVMLLDQRLQLAQDGRHIRPRQLNDIANMRGQVPLGADPGPEQILRTLISVYHSLETQIASIESSIKNRPEANHQPFGLLGTGTDVQGTIALERVSRNGLQVNPEVIKDMEREANQIYSACCLELHKISCARSCFEWQDENTICRDAKGVPRADKSSLRLALREVFQSAQEWPRKSPLDERGQFLTVPEFWDLPVDCHPFWSAWHRLNAAAAVDRLLGTIKTDNDPVVHPRYHIVPRLRSTGPNLNHFRHFRQAIFAPRAGRVFLVGRLNDLELRCFAVTDSRRSAGQSDICEAVAEANCSSREEARRLRSRYGRLARLDAVPGHELLQLARLFLVATMRALSLTQVAGLLADSATGHLHAEELISALRMDRATDTALLGTIRSTHRQDWARLPLTVRMWHPLIDERRKVLRAASRLESAEREDFMTTRAVSVNGRIGRPIYQTEALTIGSLELSDEVLKAVAYALVKAGFKLVGIAEDELVLEIAEDADQDVLDAVAAVANRPIMEFLGELGQGCWCQDRSAAW